MGSSLFYIFPDTGRIADNIQKISIETEDRKMYPTRLTEYFFIILYPPDMSKIAK